MSKLRGDAWGEPEQILLAHDSLVVAHPALSADGLTLYFTSILPAVWAELTYEKLPAQPKRVCWSEPVNLGPVINTQVTKCVLTWGVIQCFIFRPTGIRYGGLDILKPVSIRLTEVLEKVINLENR